MARYFGLIPAAGTGSRFGGETPKQYLPLAGRPLVAHAVERLVDGTPLAHTWVVLAADDTRFATTVPRSPRATALHCGGTTRTASVRNGLALIRGEVRERDWVLVHDAARPCLDRASLTRLLVGVGEDPVGGLLAVPVVDTLKRQDDAGRVASTVAREGLWQAQTPQMFRYGVLLDALAAPGADACTDEAQAVEAIGLAPKLVMGSRGNVKITWPEDLRLARALLAARDADEGDEPTRPAPR